MITLLERFTSIKMKRINEAAEDILRSFFGLASSNGGKFKSEKQAAFLLSQTDNGTFTTNQTLQFGTSSHSRRQVSWDVVCDEVGVISITKSTGKKGSELYWARAGQPGADTTISAIEQQRKRETLPAELEQIDATIVSYNEEIESIKHDLIQCDVLLNQSDEERQFPKSLLSMIEENKEKLQRKLESKQEDLTNLERNRASMVRRRG